MSAKIENVKKELLSDNWYVLHKYTFDLKRKDGGSVQQMREVYDRGNGATILLYNRAKGTVVLTNQFRMPTYVNGNESGMLLEADILQESRRLYEWVLEPLYSMAGRVTR